MGASVNAYYYYYPMDAEAIYSIPPTPAFRNVTDGTTIITAGNYTDRLFLTAGSNMTLQYFPANNTVRFSATGSSSGSGGNHSSKLIEEMNTSVVIDDAGVGNGLILFTVDGVVMGTWGDTGNQFVLNSELDMGGQNFNAGGGSDLFWFLTNDDDIHVRKDTSDGNQIDYIFFNNQQLGDNKNIATYKWNSDNDIGVLHSFVTMVVQVEDETDGTEEGTWAVSVINEGLSKNRMSYQGSFDDNYFHFTNLNRTVVQNDLIIGGNVKSGGCDGCIVMINAVSIPDSGPSNGIQLYAQDITAVSELHVRDEAGNISVLSPHDFSHVERKSALDWSFSSYNPYIGKGVAISNYEMIRALEEITGRTIIKEYNLAPELVRDWDKDQIEIKKVMDKLRGAAINEQEYLLDNINRITNLGSKANPSDIEELKYYQTGLEILEIPEIYP